MAQRIGVLQASDALHARPRTFVKKVVSDFLVRKALADRINKTLIRMRKAVESAASIICDGLIDESLERWNAIVGRVIGRSNVIPFSRVQNPMMFPERLHYPIPACGAHDRRGTAAQYNYLPPEMLRPLVAE